MNSKNLHTMDKVDKKQKQKITLYLDKQRKKNNGKYPVKLKVYCSRTYKRRYYPTIYDVTEDEFNKIVTIENEKGLSADLKDVKKNIARLKVVAEGIAEKLPYFTLDAFEQELNKGEVNLEKNLKGYYDDYINRLKRKRSIRTAEGYRLSLNSITKCNGNKAPDFFDITVEWLEQYKLWMEDNEKSLTTISMYLRNLRTIFNQAIEEGDIPENMYPFGKKKFVIPEPSATKTALKRDVVKTLFHGIPQNEYQQKAKDFWFLSYFGNGMNIKDIVYLRHRDIDGDKGYFYRLKSITTNAKPRTITFYLNDFTQEVIKKYGSEPESPSDYVFSVINKHDTPEEQLRKLKNFSRLILQHMKTYAESLKVQTPVNVKIARHSFATIAIQKGQSMEFAQEALGHSNIKTTQNYFAGFDDDTKREYSKGMMDF